MKPSSNNNTNNYNSSITAKDSFNNPNFAEIEKEILQYWNANQIFEESIANRKKTNSKQFTFYDGPPFANGLPHYGHLLTGYLKDVYCRYQTMKGCVVERRFGWDCHGLPAEMQAEKELGISGKLAIQEYGIAKFNSYCATSVMKYVNEWEEYVSRQGRWVDFKNSYKTMDISFMESVLWGFKQLYEKGYIYESVKILPYSYACQTPLSNFETRLDNSYREVTDKTVTVAFKVIANSSEFLSKIIAKYDLQNINILAWTTTPWTLPSNLALAINQNLEYIIVMHETQGYILGATAIAKYKDIIGENIIAKIQGKELVGLHYAPLMQYFTDLKLEFNNCFTILHGDFVLSEGGTSCVHLAPGFGEDDFEICKKYNIPIKCPIDNGGNFTSEVKDLEGINVFKSIEQIIAKLKLEKRCIKIENYKHNYPHCWRTDTPLIYRAVSSFYVKVTSFKARMLELNKNINWIPSHIKDNLFGKWLAGAKDWAISRNRFFGTPIPIWKSNDPMYPRIDVYGSIEQLELDFNVKIDNLHKEYLDKLTRKNPDDPTQKSMMIRCEDVFDCWFESGSMPFAQKHYPFAKIDDFSANFPADFIVEYTAQTRGWFYTLMVLSVAIFDQYPFKNCIAHGVVLDQTGQKLSKRLNNYQDPIAIFDQFGSDAVRLTMIGSSVCKGQELKIDAKGDMILESIKNIIKPLFNAMHFLVLYKEADQITPIISFNAKDILNQYILLKLQTLAIDVNSALQNFDTTIAVENIAKFINILTNWFIRRSRGVFWQSKYNAEKQEAYNTLHTVLVYFCSIAAPLMPFSAEYIFLHLTGKKSVHLEDYPEIKELICNSKEEQDDLIILMDLAIEICSLALSIRNKLNIKIRQPLQKMQIGLINANLNLSKIENIIKEEINIKEIEIIEDLNSVATKVLTLHFPIIGKRIPADVKALIQAQKNNASWEINMQNKTLTIAEITLQENEYSITFKPLLDEAIANDELLIAIDKNITPSLKQEGIARDIVRGLQNIRKELNLNVNSYISVAILETDRETEIAWNSYYEYISTQCLIIAHEKLITLNQAILSKNFALELENNMQINIYYVS